MFLNLFRNISRTFQKVFSFKKLYNFKFFVDKKSNAWAGGMLGGMDEGESIHGTRDAWRAGGSPAEQAELGEFSRQAKFHRIWSSQDWGEMGTSMYIL